MNLDWIVGKAIEKDRTRRYGSAAELGKDVQRYLDKEAVQASPPSRRYLIGKFARRHKGLLATLTTIALVLISATIISTRTTIRSIRAERHATTQLARSEAISAFMEKTLKAAGPSVALGRDTRLLMDILEDAERRLDKELGDQPEIRADLKSIISMTYFDIEEIEESLRLTQAAVEIYRGLPEVPKNETRPHAARLG